MDRLRFLFEWKTLPADELEALAGAVGEWFAKKIADADVADIRETISMILGDPEWRAALAHDSLMRSVQETESQDDPAPRRPPISWIRDQAEALSKLAPAVATDLAQMISMLLILITSVPSEYPITNISVEW